METRTYSRLDDALTDVARRSFYEDCIVTPLLARDGRVFAWTVEDEGGAGLADDWTWTYGGGVEGQGSADEVSRLHDPYEHYATAEHIRYNMPESVEALESGTHAVTFAYAIVYDGDVTWDDDSQVYLDEDGHEADDVAGWILAANHWEMPACHCDDADTWCDRHETWEG